MKKSFLEEPSRVLNFLRVYVQLNCDTHDLAAVSVNDELRAVPQGLHQIMSDGGDVQCAVRREHEGERDHDAAWRQMSD